MIKFKVGDKVRIKKNLKVDCRYNNGCLFVQEMEKYKGKNAVIKNGHIPIYLNGNDKIENTNNYRYELDIDGGDCYWSSSMLEKVEDKKHFKSLPRDFTGTIKIENGFIAKIVKEKKEILDKVEKEYLSAVIKPFKKQVTFINLRKRFGDNRVYIYIEVKNNDCVILPLFEQGTMYKNMQMNREYTLKELGLD